MKVRAAELAIAILVIAIVAMLVVPLPTQLLDILLTLNIAISVALLMAAVFTRRPLTFASFPTLLVITTLFRVGLEVSTTRLILANADAGEVVHAFGSSVVASSLVVGLVVFAVITIVQLVVVARGAERVAEVAARFALDAMPGKQMAIDADVRAGSIDGETARRRRADLERESQLYGAMDGAMRFVKGDAIAAIVIVVINLVGGLIIGVGYRGMSAGQAVSTYSLLSIGAGLVAQIPSLLVAVGSGLLVTRVASTGDAAIGADLGEQLTSRALIAVAILLVGLGLVPGLPLVPFVLLGLAAAAGAFVLRDRTPRTSNLDEPGASEVRGPRLSLRTPRAIADLHARLSAAREGVMRATGVPIPPMKVEVGGDVGAGGGADDFVLSIDATPVAWFTSLDELESRLRAIAPELLGVDRVSSLLEQAAARAPMLVREAKISLPSLTELLRTLVREGVPIDDLAAILDALTTTTDPETIRGRLHRQISARFAPRGQIAVYTVDAMIEDAVRSAVDRRDGTAILALEPAIAQDIVAAVKAKVSDGVILTSSDVRKHLRSVLEPELPNVAVIAAHELTAGTAVTTIGRIEVA
jgi:type III secretion protein V